MEELDRIKSIMEKHELDNRPATQEPEPDPILEEAQRVATAQGGSLTIGQVHGLLKQKTGWTYKSKVIHPDSEKSSPVYVAVKRGTLNSIKPELGGARQIVIDDKFLTWLSDFAPRSTE